MKKQLYHLTRASLFIALLFTFSECKKAATTAEKNLLLPSYRAQVAVF